MGVVSQIKDLDNSSQSQPIIIMYMTHPPSPEGEFLLQAPFGKGSCPQTRTEGLHQLTERQRDTLIVYSDRSHPKQ